jgi:hypothetical protein
MGLKWENFKYGPLSSSPSGVLDRSSDDLLNYWRGLEMIQGIDIPGESQEFELGEDSKCPWFNQFRSESDPIRYAIYGACIGGRERHVQESQVLGELGITGHSTRKSYALYVVAVEIERGYQRGSFSLSTTAYAMERLLHKEDPQEGFQEQESSLRSYADELLNCPIDELGSRLNELTAWVISSFGINRFFTARKFNYRWLAQHANDSGVFREAKLSSPILEDIEVVRACLKRGIDTEVIRSFLGREHLIDRLDVESQEGESQSITALLPSSCTLGSWPCDEELSMSERLATNLVLGELGNKDGVQAISLPMSASPHRLMREIVAEALIGRADILASYPRTSFAFVNLDTGAQQRNPERVWKLSPELCEFSVVVSSPEPTHLKALGELLMLPRIGDEECDLVDQILRIGFLSAAPGCPVWSSNFIEDHFGDDVGLSRLLRDAEERTLIDEEKHTTWHKATSDYAAAKKRVLKLRNLHSPLTANCKSVSSLRSRRKSLERNKLTCERMVAKRTHELEVLLAQEHELQSQEKCRACTPSSPGLLGKLGVLLFSGVTKGDVEAAECEKKDDFARLKRLIERAMASHSFEMFGLRQADDALQRIEQDLLFASGQALESSGESCAPVLSEWLKGNNPLASNLEFSGSLLDEELTRAQQDVFIKALRLHAVFIRLESKKVMHNLQLAAGVALGSYESGLDEESASAVWDSFFLVCPVMRVNTLEVSQALKGVSHKQIGWMIMCDAGRISPQSVLGALYRSKRYVSIGSRDDLQSRYIPAEHLCKRVGERLKVNPRWHSNDLSAHSVAEECSPYGYLRVTDQGREWIGVPIRSVEAGNEPMLSILNRLTCGTELVARHDGGATADDFDSGWIDVREAAANGSVEVEMNAVSWLLGILDCRGVECESIAITSPFNRTKSELSRRLGRLEIPVLDLEEMAGRQSQYVILVLGGGDPRSRAGVGETAGYLATAASCAQRGLFVIGDRREWGKRPAMKAAVELLPGVTIDVRLDEKAG